MAIGNPTSRCMRVDAGATVRVVKQDDPPGVTRLLDLSRRTAEDVLRQRNALETQIENEAIALSKDESGLGVVVTARAVGGRVHVAIAQHGRLLAWANLTPEQSRGLSTIFGHAARKAKQ